MKKYAYVIGFLAAYATIAFPDNPKRIEFIPQHGSSHIDSIAVHPDGNRVAVADRNYIIKIMDINRNMVSHILREHGDRIVDLKFGPKGVRLASVSINGDLIVWSRDFNPLMRFDLGRLHADNRIAFSDDGLSIAVSTPSRIKVFDLYAMMQTHQLSHRKIESAWFGKYRRKFFTAVAVSGNRRWIAAASNRGKVFVWDFESKRYKYTLNFGGYLHQLSFDLGGNVLMAANKRGKVFKWNVSKNKQASPPGEQSTKEQLVDFQPYYSIYAVGDEDQLQIRRLHTHKLQASLKLPVPVSRIQFTPDGKHIIAVTDKHTSCHADSGQIAMISLKGDLKILFEPGVRALNTPVAVSADNRTMAAAVCSRNVQTWDLQSAAKKSTINGGFGLISALAYSPDGKFLVIGARGGFRIWDVDGDSIVKDVYVPGLIRQIQFHPGGDEFVIALDTDIVATTTQKNATRHSGSLAAYHSETGQLLHLYKDINRGVRHLAFLDKRQLAVVTTSGNVLLLDHTSRKTVAKLHPTDDFKIEANQFISLGKSKHKIALVGEDKNKNRSLTLWAHRIRQVITTVNIPLETVPVFSPDDAHLVTVDKSHHIRIYDGSTLKPLATLPRHDTQINQLAFSHDGAHLISAARDGWIRVWQQHDKDDYRLKFNLLLLPGDRGISWHPAFPFYYSDRNADSFVLLKFSDNGRSRISWLPNNRSELMKQDLLDAIKQTPNLEYQFGAIKNGNYQP